MSKSYLASARLLAIMTLISRVLGLVRDMLMASLFGAFLVFDAWVLAFTVPNLFRRMFGEGALSAAFIPTFAQTLEDRGPAPARALLSRICTLLVTMLTGLTLVGVAACLAWRAWANPGERTELFCLLLAVLLPYVIFICLTALLSGALNTLDHFFMPSLAPILFNVLWIITLVLLMTQTSASPRRLILMLAGAVSIAGMAQVALLLPALARQGYLPRPLFELRDPAVRKIGSSMGPILFGVAIFQLNVLTDRLIAWLLVPEEGALSVLYLGNRLMQFPLGVIGIAMGTAVFPLLSRLAAGKQQARFRSVMTESITITLFLAVPASIGLILVREPLIQLFFEHRAFTAQASARTAVVLMWYSLGIWATCLANLATRGFYSLDQVRTPVRIGIWIVLLNLTLNLLLVGPMGEAGLALATALSHVINALALLLLLHRQLLTTGGAGGLSLDSLGRDGIKVALISGAMAGVVAGALHLLADRSLALQLAGAVGSGLLSYLLLAGLIAPDLLRKLVSPAQVE